MNWFRRNATENDEESPSAGGAVNNNTPSTSPSSYTTISRLNVFNALAYLCNLVISYGVGNGGFSFFLDLPTNATLSEKYPTPVTPADWTFLIWALIFIVQLGWAWLAQLIEPTSPWVTSVGYGYIRVCALQCLWAIVFALEFIPVSCGIMLLLMLSLGWIVKNLSAYETTVVQYLLWKLPFYLHLGWILAATVVNVAVTVTAMKLDEKVDNLQFYVCAGGLAFLLIVGWVYARYDFVIPLVLVWALSGIYVKLEGMVADTEDNNNTTLNHNQLELLEYGTAGVAASLAVFSLIQGARWSVGKGKRGEPINGQQQQQHSPLQQSPLSVDEGDSEQPYIRQDD